MATHAMGQSEAALPLLREVLAMNRRHYGKQEFPDGHPDLSRSINNVGFVLNAMGRFEEALAHYREAVAIDRKVYPATKYPAGHPVLAGALSNLGWLLQRMGQTGQSLPVTREALEMRRRLFPVARYPAGHPELALSLNNLAGTLSDLGRHEEALGLHGEALAMRRRLYPAARFPNGHADLAQSVENTGKALLAAGRPADAADQFRNAVAMQRKLAPDGHADLARSLNELGAALQRGGRPADALSLFREALELDRRLYPAAHHRDGHPSLAVAMSNLAGALDVTDRPDLALPLERAALAMHARLMRTEAVTVSEEAAFDRATVEPRFLHYFLSVSGRVGDPAADAYTQVWPHRARIARLIEQRQAAARAAGAATEAKLDRLRGLRRRTDSLLADNRLKLADRDRRLAEVADERDRLERELVAELPPLRRWQELDKLGPSDLAAALPAGAAFIDVIRYDRHEGARSTPSYVAFVVTWADAAAPRRPSVARIELGEAAAIDRAVGLWRAAIETGRDLRGGLALAPVIAPARADECAREVARLAWQPIAARLPAGAGTLYFAVDGDMARIPWAALPIGDRRVLLEDFAVAQVPHGLFLLDQLRREASADAPMSLFALGGLDYGGSGWPKLPGTAVELRTVAALAPGKSVTADGLEARPDRVVRELARARYAHLATHGEFKARDFSAEKSRAAQATDGRVLGDDPRRVAAKNPLGFVGLVLSAGDPLSGLGIVDLRLDDLKLVTLSACETGLGEFTGAKGVENLQMAFHLAGAQNVVASLWKVNDAATAALMTTFYDALWTAKKSPIEALRQAQLAIWRHPDLIADLAGDRGAPKAKAAQAVATGLPGTRQSRTPTRLWAAFTLSGLGR